MEQCEQHQTMLLLYKLGRLKFNIVLILTISTVHLISVKSHVCLLVRRPDPSQGGTLRWSLPKHDICRCQCVKAPIVRSTCSALPGRYDVSDLWFVDNPRPLTMRSNWKKGMLDELLERTAYCDIDECTDGTHNCNDNAECSNTVGSFICACKPGYDGNGISCTDIDECTYGTHNCDVNAECSNIDGSFNCTCTPGYDGGGINCTDIDECTDGLHNCGVNAECSNVDGSFHCTCRPGYDGDGINCTDIDECTDGTHNCDVNAECSNIDGSFHCACTAGYDGDGISCTDIDECSDGTHYCDVNADCCNIDGSFKCTCKPGYVGYGIFCMATGSCNERLGVEDSRINDSQITASSEFYNSPCFAASNARLNLNTMPYCQYPVSWSAERADVNPWIQVALGAQKWVTGVLLQGRDSLHQRVTQFKVTYSDDGENWQYVGQYVCQTKNQTDMIFVGNQDANTVVTNIFPQWLVTASFIQIYPVAWNVHASLRFELLGC